jgi:hypothetical protein
MSATFVSSSTYSVSSQVSGMTATATVTAPSSISEGNTLIVCLYGATGITGAIVSWALADWSFTTVTQGVGTGTMSLGIKTAVTADTTAPSYAFVGTSDYNGSTWWIASTILNYSGLGSSFTTTPSAVSVTTYATTVAAPAVSPAVGGDLLLAFFGTYSGTAPSTTPAGMTTQASVTNAGNESLIALDQVLWASGTTGTRTQTWSAADASVGSLVTISPLVVADSAPLGSLADPFNAPALNTAAWTQTLGGSTTMTYAYTGAAIVFPHHAHTSDMGQLTSNAPYDFTGSILTLHVVTVPNPAGSADCMVGVYINSDNWMQWAYENGTLFAQLMEATVKTTVASFAYSSTTHAYWRISESAGVATWWTSSDGIVWTTQGTYTYGLTITNMGVYMSMTCWQDETSAGFFRFNALNSNDQPLSMATY